MTSNPDACTPRLVDALERVANRHRVARKLVVAPNHAIGRELLRRLSLARGGWIGFDVTTPRPLALRVARRRMEAAGLTLLDAFEEQSVLDRALDWALGTVGGGLGELSEGVGFRERVHGAVQAMRLAGVAPRDVERARLEDWRKRRFLGALLQRYERLLTERGRADTATVLTLALAEFEENGSTLPPVVDADVVVLVPGLGSRGLTGRLLSALTSRGAKVLETDPVLGIDRPDRVLWNHARVPAPGSGLFAVSATGGEGDAPAPEVVLFRAASIEEELRAVLRHVVERGLSWDEVEVIASAPAAYGSALHALSAGLGVPVTYAVGLPLERTRTGRVVRAYLEWIEEGFHAAPIRRLLEAGDLRPRGKDGPAAAALARRFRSLRIGWGRTRYRDQIRMALEGLDRQERSRRETEARFERRVTTARRELKALRSILFPALKATPTVPDRGTSGSATVSPSEIARGLRAFLRRVPPGRGPDRTAREEVGRILERVETVLRRRTDFRAAVAILRRHLDIRVRVERSGVESDERGAPWASEGGALHLSDLEHGGYTGRRAIFLVGVDADRVPGPGGQDPVLLDADRRVLSDELPTSTEQMDERAFRVAALFARLRGPIFLSYTAWAASEAREAGPSPLLLQALRLARRDPDLTFRDLDVALGPVVSSIPRPNATPLDARDVWMTALGGEGVLRTGVDVVRRAYPFLDRGLDAHRQRLGGVPGPVHGVVAPRPEALDPRRNADIVLSASALEALGTCPLRYLHKTVLRLYPPDDPEFDPDRWLDPRRRGGLLHGVFEELLRTAGERGVAADDPELEAIAARALAAAIERMRAEAPIPGAGALRRESAELQEDVRSFIRMIRQHGAAWLRLELGFGLGGDEPVELSMGGGTLRLRGAIDRVDENLEGLRVVDYKTGRVRDHSDSTGSFHGGRRLQHAIYARVAEELLDGTVVAGEYHYPTVRGQNEVVSYDRFRLASLDGLVQLMLDGVAAGRFVPTGTSDDCVICDYAEICRARRGTWGGIDSPLADWAQEHLNAGLHPEFHHLKKTRTFED